MANEIGKALPKGPIDRVIEGMLELFSQEFEAEDIPGNGIDGKPLERMTPKNIDKLLKIQLGEYWGEDMVNEMIEWIRTGLEEYFYSKLY